MEENLIKIGDSMTNKLEKDDVKIEVLRLLNNGCSFREVAEYVGIPK